MYIMKKLLEKIFKKEPQLHYIIAAYQPLEVNMLGAGVKITEYDLNDLAESDEMQIDKIYQRS